MDTGTRSLLVGRRPVLTRRYLLVGLLLFTAFFGYTLSDAVVILPLWVFALVVVGVPAVHAYHNDGLVVSLLLGLALPLGFYVPLTVFDLASPSEDLLWGIGAALMFGVPAGLVGFGLGVGASRLRERI